MAKKEPMSDAELLAITGNEIRQSTGYRTGKLSAARQKNLQYYLCRPVGDLAPPEIEGRSAVVDSSVHDTVEWMLPSLIKTFTGGDSVVEFAPQRQDDEEAASQATDYVNYVFYRQNSGFQILNTWFKDALLSKVGVLKVMWDETCVEAREEYNGLSEESLQMIADDDEVEIIEHTAKPDEEDAEQRQKSVQQLTQQLQQAMQAQGDPQAQQAVQQIQAQLQQIQSMPPVMLHDIACKRTKNTKQVKIYNVPPEEFLINRDAKSIADARFVAHQVLRTISDLNASGYKDTESLTSDDIQAAMSAERIERITFNDETGWQSGANEVPGDPSQKQIWVTECYMKVDADGDGIAEWRKITRSGNKILDNEECDAPPFVSITPIPLPHQFFGLCPADQALEIQKQKTVVMRAIHDNLSLSVNGRYFAVDGQVNLDDLLTSRPGGVVRMKQAGMAGRLDQGNADAAGAYQFLDYIELQKEQRTGLMRNTQGVNADAMNQTATGINITTNRADTRLELIARNFAETGVKDLFKLILKLICQHQDKEAQIHVAGKWIAIDPRAWRNQYDMTINVGLGTGNKDQEVQHLMALTQSQQQAFAMGIVTPANVFAAHKKLSQALGYKQEGLFFSDPNDPKTKESMPPPPPNPDDAKHQAQAQQQQSQQQHDAQIEQMKMQHDAQKAQFDAQGKQQEVAASMQIERDKMTMQAQVDQNRQEVEAQQQDAKRQGEAELAQYMAQLKAQADDAKLQHDLQLTQMKLDADREKWEFDGAIRLQVAQISAQNALDTASIGAQQAAANEVTQELGGNDDVMQAITQLAQSVGAIHKHMSSPKTIVRGADGRATGVSVNGVVQSIQRDSNGRATGV
jgi:hypothetical protein